VFVALAILHTMRMRRIMLPSLAWLALAYFSTLSHKWHDFRKEKNNSEHEIYVQIFSTTSVWNISHPKNNSARYYHQCTYVVM